MVEYAILGEGCRVGKDCRVGGSPMADASDTWGGLTVLAPGCCLEEGREVRPGVMLGKNAEEVSK